MKAPKILFLTILIVAVYVLHQDFWNWKSVEPLVFGFLPVGLAYHAGYSVLAAILMAILVKFAWPKHLEDVEPTQTNKNDNRTEGH
jgi:hypothetical protein